MSLNRDVSEFLQKLGERDYLDPATASIVEMRRANRQMELDFDVPETPMFLERALEIPGPAGGIPIRIYWPRKVARDARMPMMLFCHGGGWVLCDLDTHENMCRYLCKYGDVIGISVGYCLAPEHKFPAAVDDAYAALSWAAENAQVIGGNVSEICVAGDSAGGNLAAVLTQLTKAKQGPPIAAQLLVYPSVGMGVKSRYRSWNEYCEPSGKYGLVPAVVDRFLDSYLRSPEDLVDVRFTPILADDFKDLPRALIITAECDPIRDESEEYAARLAEAGVLVDYKSFKGTIHAFMSLAGAISAGFEGLDYASAFLREAFGPRGHDEALARSARSA